MQSWKQTHVKSASFSSFCFSSFFLPIGGIPHDKGLLCSFCLLVSGVTPVHIFFLSVNLYCKSSVVVSHPPLAFVFWILKHKLQDHTSGKCFKSHLIFGTHLLFRLCQELFLLAITLPIIGGNSGEFGPMNFFEEESSGWIGAKLCMFNFCCECLAGVTSSSGGVLYIFSNIVTSSMYFLCNSLCNNVLRTLGTVPYPSSKKYSSSVEKSKSDPGSVVGISSGVRILFISLIFLLLEFTLAVFVFMGLLLLSLLLADLHRLFDFFNWNHSKGVNNYLITKLCFWRNSDYFLLIVFLFFLS